MRRNRLTLPPRVAEPSALSPHGQRLRHPRPDGSAPGVGLTRTARPRSLTMEAAESADPLDVVTAERDTYLADLQRVQAEFANFRRQATKRQSDTIEHAASALVNKLLPVLDACDAALCKGRPTSSPFSRR